MWDILIPTQGGTLRVAFSNGTISLSIMSLPYLSRTTWERRVIFTLGYRNSSCNLLRNYRCLFILFLFIFLWELLNNTFLLNTQTCLVTYLSQFTSGLMQELKAETVLCVFKVCQEKNLPVTESSKCRPVEMLNLLLTVWNFGEYFPQAVRHTCK